MSKSDNPFIAFLAIVTAPIAAGALLLSWAPSNHFFEFSPKYDGYVAARDISGTVDAVQDATLTVFCGANSNRGSLGTAWAIDKENLQVKSDKTLLVTNHHVIEDCIGKEKYLTVARAYKKQISAEIITIDKENDLAVLISDLHVPSLTIATAPPYVGYWVMTSGSADAYEGSVTFGTILNSSDKELF